MPAYTERQEMPYECGQLFDLVLDIERYPEFLPWCRAARILERGEGEFLAELVIAFSHLSESYTSRVVYQRPGFIDVTMVKGPFEYLVNRWRFTPTATGTEIDFSLDFKFRSRMLEMMVGSVFRKATSSMVQAFKERAEQLYGKRP